MYDALSKGQKARSYLVQYYQSETKEITVLVGEGMNAIHRDIFKAIHEGKWLSIEYRNQDGYETKYWIGIKALNVLDRTMSVDGMHLGELSVLELKKIRIDMILSSQIVEGTYYPVNEELVKDIYLNAYKYEELFDNVANLEVLSYLEMCSKLDTVPYLKNFDLVRYLDGDKLNDGNYSLNEEQFQYIVHQFQNKTEQEKQRDGSLHMQKLALNVLSIHTQKGLYVLAYRHLRLDIVNKVLRADKEIVICTEFTIDGNKQSVRKFLDADDYALLGNFEKNQEKIKDCIVQYTLGRGAKVDDMPYIIGLGSDIPIDLHNEYKAIIKMYQNGNTTVPIKAFFGDLLERPNVRGVPTIVLLNQNINMDQLLAINNAMKYPISYVQGPPGTGKTNTIMNTIVTAFFNEKTVLFASYNNHPINSVYEKLSSIKYHNNTIPFPILRLGNREKVTDAIEYIKNLYENTKNIKVYEATLDRNKDDRKERSKRLAELLKKYYELLDLEERKETIKRMLEHSKENARSMQMIPFQADLSGRQINLINKRIENAGDTSEESALKLLDRDTEELKKYLYYTSAKYIQRMKQDRFSKLRDIVFGEMEEKEKVEQFSRYLKDKDNLILLQEIFPIIATTCISAHQLGDAAPMFDITIMDEASQCNTAVSLVPIIRGKSLLLVGDPQQLNPVVVLSEAINDRLKKRYHVTEEYDYKRNSIYKTFLSCDSVSEEILLRNHYRCNKRIIEFNNKKYYNSKLNVKSTSEEKVPLEYVDIQDATSVSKNTALEEAKEIAKYAANHRDKSIGVITPFVNQKLLIEKELDELGVKDVTCGTVHAFQGDEKDVVLFSTAITANTKTGTYEWLKNNKELINVATSRAKDKLIVFSSKQNLERLHKTGVDDDLYELVEYVIANGEAKVTPKMNKSRALGVKPYSTQTEEAFLQNLTHALENIWMTQSKYVVRKEVAISHVFENCNNYKDLFYRGRFDFVVYDKQGNVELPILAIELDGKEHYENDVVMARDMKKNAICKEHNLQLIRVENSYARRYNHIKEILINYFKIRH